MPTKELPLHQHTVVDLFIIIYIYVDDYLKALSTRHFPKWLEKVRLTRENRTRLPMSWPS